MHRNMIEINVTFIEINRALNRPNFSPQLFCCVIFKVFANGPAHRSHICEKIQKKKRILSEQEGREKSVG